MADRHKNSRRGRQGSGQPDPNKDRSEHEAARGQQQAQSALHDLSDDELHAALADIESGSDRVAGIMCAALVENTLIGSLVTCLTDKENPEKLFDEKGPFNTFNTRIVAGRALGLYNERIEDMLHLVRKVRNKFAHSVLSLDFKDSQIVSWCTEMRPFEEKEAIDDREIEVARRYYEHACYHFTACLLAAGTRNVERHVLDLKQKIASLEKPKYPNALLGLGNFLNLIPAGLEDSD